MSFPVNITMVLRIRKWSSIQRVNMSSHSIVSFFRHNSIGFYLFFVILLFLIRLFAMIFLPFHKLKIKEMLLLQMLNDLFILSILFIIKDYYFTYNINLIKSIKRSMINFTTKIFKQYKHVHFILLKQSNICLKKLCCFSLMNKQQQFFSTQTQINITDLKQVNSQLNYTQQAYTPLQISQMIRQNFSSKSKEEIIHQFNLFYLKIVAFDYDYFQEGLRYLVADQRFLNINQIKIIYKLSQQYKIQNPIVQNHIQAQLYLKLYSSLNHQLIQYDKQLHLQTKKMLQKLQKNSQDYFQIISQQNTKEDQQELQQQTNHEGQDHDQLNQLTKVSEITPIIKPIHNKSKKKIKFSTQQIEDISKMVLKSQSKNNEFLKLLLQTLTIRCSKQLMSSTFMITYTALTITILQNYMQTFTLNSKSYTKRSIKRIYNLQTMYYFQIIKFIEERKLLQQMPKQQFLQFVDLISSFPIKRRHMRKQLGIALIQKCKQQQLQFIVLQKFFKLNRNDNRLLINFQNLIQGKPTIEADLKMLQNKGQNQIKVYKIDQSLFRSVKPKKASIRRQGNHKKHEEIDLTGQNQCQADIQVNNIKIQQKKSQIVV